MGARNYQFRWAFANTKQSAYGTAVADGSIDKSGFIKGPDLAVRTPRVIRDNDQFGGGDEWSRTQEIDAWDLDLRRSMDLTSLLAGLFCGFGLGSVTTTTPVGGVFQHVFKPINSATTLQLPAMTIVEEAINNTGIKKKIQDLVINDFEVSGEGLNRLQIAANLKGSGQWANSTLTMPAVAAAKFLRMKDTKFELGLYGGALTDISSRVKRFRFKWNNNLAGDDGYTANSGLYRSRLEIGLTRGAELEFDLLQDTNGQELDRVDANTNLALKITAEGEIISGAHKHTLIIDCSDIHYSKVENKYIDGKLAHGITANVNYDDAGGVLSPVVITVKNDQSAYL